MKAMDAQDILVECGGEMRAGARTHFVPAVLAPSARDAFPASVRDAFHHHSSTRHQCSPLSISSDIVVQQDRRRQRLLCRRTDRTRPFLLCGSSRAERVRFCDLTVRRGPAMGYSRSQRRTVPSYSCRSHKVTGTQHFDSVATYNGLHMRTRC